MAAFTATGRNPGWLVYVGVAMFAIPVGKATGLDINLLIAVSGLLDDRHRLRHFGADGSFGDCGSGYRLPGRLFRCGWPLTAWAAWTH